MPSKAGPDLIVARFKLPMILQSETAECGLACIAMIAGYFGRATTLRELRGQFAVSLKGATLKTLIQIASALGMDARAVRLELDELADLHCPAILHWQFDHFVVLERLDRRGRALIHNPAVGVRRYSRNELSRYFTGVALELQPSRDFEPRRAGERLGLTQLVGGIPGLKPAVTQILVLSVLIQTFALGSPLYMQTVVDEVLVKQDGSLLTVIALGFVLLVFFSSVTRTLRDWVMLQASTSLGVVVSGALFRHLLRLPFQFFAKRHVGDVISRFESMKPVQQFLTDGAVSVLVDGGLALTTLGLMFLYAPGLSLVVLGFLSVYLALRLLTFAILRTRSGEALVARAELDSAFVETLQAIHTIKVSNREDERTRVWLNRLTEATGADVQVGRLNILYNSGKTFVIAMENVVVIYLGAQLVMDTVLTIGMLYAFIAYKNHFSNAITALVDQLNAYRMLGLHLERIADIAQTPGETGLVTQSAFLAPVSGALEMVGVSYRYGEGEPEVVSELSMSVGQGEVVCLRGPTGCGKSTVLKIAMGLIEPTSGSVVVGEQDLKGLGARRFRAAIASVASEDTLLQGSVFDNVSLFELEPVGERVEWACRQAEIHQEISLMPMGYQTQIGPAGGGLSAGQRQRLLLARALYRQPTYLFLDEATANLDTNTERRVMENLRSLELSCLVATHSDAVASYAHRQLDFGTRLALNATDRMNG